MAASLKERLGLAVAAEADDSEPEKLRPLTPVEREWKQRIYDRLLKVLDLSLLTSVEEGIARAQIREITNRLFLEECAPLSMRNGDNQIAKAYFEDASNSSPAYFEQAQKNLAVVNDALLSGARKGGSSGT